MKTGNKYEVNLLALHEGVNEFDYIISGDFFDPEENPGVLGADVDVHLEVKRRHESYDFTFSFDGELQAACDRCLEAVPVEIAEDYHVVVRHGEDIDSSTTGDGEELMVIAESATHLDVAPIIRDTLLLSIPLRCVHPEGECNPQMAERLRDHNADTAESPEGDTD